MTPLNCISQPARDKSGVSGSCRSRDGLQLILSHRDLWAPPGSAEVLPVSNKKGLGRDQILEGVMKKKIHPKGWDTQSFMTRVCKIGTILNLQLVTPRGPRDR